jgi:hypothetical protein
MKIGHTAAIVSSGVLWFLIGLPLLVKGLNLLVKESGQEGEGVVLLVAAGLFIGFFKNKLVLSKTVRRVVGRILSLPNPVPLAKVYAPSYFFLIVGMGMLGMGLKWIPIFPTVRGVIDVAVGSALMHGALLYFRSAREGIVLQQSKR